MVDLPEPRTDVVGLLPGDPPLSVLSSLGAGGAQVLVVISDEIRYGLHVLEVLGVRRFDDDQVSPPPKGSASAGRILVAEDSPVVRAVVCDQPEDEGCEVVEAVDRESALAECARVRPDAILLDIEMPGLDGHQVLARLKADSDLSDIPVVFLTGHTSTADMVAGLRRAAPQAEQHGPSLRAAARVLDARHRSLQECQRRRRTPCR